MPTVEAIVLDTHVWLDVAVGRGRVARRIMRKLERAGEAGVLYVAAITPWEIAMLARAGKLRVSGPLLGWLVGALAATQTAVAPLEPEVAVDAVELPAWQHGDPADRLIVATARRLDATLVTRDAAILDYADEMKGVRAVEPS
ncbi:MAG: type II toxin-antitoxin system VapC family toxin [Myxococcales bacterium]|nr:type II toxin-antitoxin system VapC family toxin [Myxococcales bacterium]